MYAADKSSKLYVRSASVYKPRSIPILPVNVARVTFIDFVFLSAADDP